MTTTNLPKYDAEMEFWKNEIGWYVKWYRGEVPELYFRKAPTPQQRITCYETEEDNAIETWCLADRDRYLKHLMLPPNYLVDGSILDVGGGPLGLVRALAGAAVWIVIDPLTHLYKACGYGSCMDRQACIYWNHPVEKMEAFFDVDAIVSVNALDHVDDFDAAMLSMANRLKPGGFFRVEIHYHAPTATEPLALSDERVAAALDKTSLAGRVKKIAETPFETFYPGFGHDGEILALWGTDDYLYQGYEVP